ncbi:MAG: glycosyltransferase [Candidatus Tectimicrobiota bacterium]
MPQDRVSIIIAAYNEGENLVDTVRCLLHNTSGVVLEIVVVDDASTDASGRRVGELFAADGRVSVVRSTGLGITQARNLGASAASGDIYIFLDGHCYAPPGWLPLLIEPLRAAQVGMVGPAFADLQHQTHVRGLGVTWRNASLDMVWLPQQATTPYAVPLLPGGCDAMRRQVFTALGGYDAGLTRWGSVGQELSLRTWLMGYEVVVQPQVSIYHLFRARHPYPVSARNILYNRLRMALLHLGQERAIAVLQHYAGTPDFAAVVYGLLQSDVMLQRQRLQALRQRDDTWFFSRFAPWLWAASDTPESVSGSSVSDSG